MLRDFEDTEIHERNLLSVQKRLEKMMEDEKGFDVVNLNRYASLRSEHQNLLDDLEWVRIALGR